MDEQQLLSQLNDSQRAAVTCCDCPQLVIAGAGSGKTRVLTFKIAYLLQHYDMKPWNILALTFTNKAAREMKNRIGRLAGEERARYLQMGTFHSVFSHILRVEAQMLGFTSNFTIYDEQDSRSLLKNILKQMLLDDKTYKPSSVHSVISNAKNRLCLPEQYAQDGNALAVDRARNMPELYKIYANYQLRLRQANAMDFDDLLVYTYQLLRQHEDIRKKYSERFQYVLVDEYQDTNYAQQQIVTLLTKEHNHICVVGDDYQSIYAFRGANINNILHFNRTYPDAKLFKLEQNYRSTQNIVAAANSLMKKNRGMQIDKDVYSKNAEGEKVTVLETISDKREAAIVCREIKRIRQEEHCSWKDFAILYRTNAQSRLFEEEMRKPEVGMGACYRIYGGLSFYQRKEVKDVIAYFRLVVNPNDEEAFRRILNYPARGIGDTTLSKIIATAQATGQSLWQVIAQPMESGLQVNRGTVAKLYAFRDLIQSFIQQEEQGIDALTVAQDIITRSGIQADLAADKTAEGDSRRENLDSLLSGIADFVNGQREDDQADHVSLNDYLATVSLMTDTDSGSDSDDKVSLMTIHSAKGLEFGTVFVVGLEENIFPSQLSLNSAVDLAEERRLLYVAITRAERHCFLSWAHTRWQYGKMNGFVQPSRFINDIDSKFVNLQVEGGHQGGALWEEDAWSGNSRGGRRSYNPGQRRPWDQGQRRPWDIDYEPNLPYTGYHDWGEGTHRLSSRMQNSRPVAGQFMAEPKEKITTPHKAEEAVNPFSESFANKLKQSGHWSKVQRAITNGGRAMGDAGSGAVGGRPLGGSRPAGAGTPGVGPSVGSSVGSSAGSGNAPLKEGDVIEHQRFGKGTVIRIEGSGENTKATVRFEMTGEKQLLLKFAKYRVI